MEWFWKKRYSIALSNIYSSIIRNPVLFSTKKKKKFILESKSFISFEEKYSNFLLHLYHFI